MDFLLLKVFLMHLGMLFSVPLIFIVMLYFMSPATLFTLGAWCLSWKYGLKERYAEHQGYRFCYFSLGKPSLKPSILLLHGFSLRKESWLFIIKYFPKDTHLICIDMPGHGKTSCLPGDSYSGFDQARRIHQFVECIGLNRQPFHLVGISMGGMVAGLYAAQHPSDLCALTLLCPAGLRYPVDNELMKKMKELEKTHKLYTENPLIPLTVTTIAGFLKLTMYKSMKLPNQILRGMLKRREQESNFFVKCFSDLFSEENRYQLQDNISKIKTPTLVIWGKNDHVLDPSGAEILARAIPDTQVHVLEKCGHLITLDMPTKAMGFIMDFHTSLSIKMSKKLV
ncbi:monoacylglycerol lipase ABHD6 [Pogona vitticeps]